MPPRVQVRDFVARRFQLSFQIENLRAPYDNHECDDIDKTYKELTKRGVEFEGPPQKQPWGTYAMFKDSEGNRFVVSS